MLGTPLFVVALWQLFLPGGQASVVSLLGWSALLYLGFTMIDLPHKAWGAELSSDYDERSRITSWREGLSTGGQVVLLAALVGWGARGVSDAADQLRGIALVVVIALPLLVAAAVAGSIPTDSSPRPSQSVIVPAASRKLNICPLREV